MEKYIHEIEERIIWRLQTEFKDKSDLVQSIVADNFEQIYKKLEVASPSEDKTAEQVFMDGYYETQKEIGTIDIRWKEPILKAMTEYGTLRWNKAIEEAVAIAESNGNHSTAHDINKLKLTITLEFINNDLPLPKPPQQLEQIMRK